MNTHFALLARFGNPIVQLSDISEEFFGMKKRTAQDKVTTGEFPIPTFKLSEQKGAPILVHVEDLSTFIDSKLSAAREQHARVNA